MPLNKLNSAQVKAIMIMHAERVPRKVIASMFSVTPDAISWHTSGRVKNVPHTDPRETARILRDAADRIENANFSQKLNTI